MRGRKALLWIEGCGGLGEGIAPPRGHQARPWSRLLETNGAAPSLFRDCVPIGGLLCSGLGVHLGQEPA